MCNEYVKPHRDALAAAIRLRHREMGSGVETVTVDDYESADAVLDLWPGRSEAEIRAEAVREVAKAYRKCEDDAYLFLAGSWLRVPWSAVARDLDDRAASLATEGGADR